MKFAFAQIVINGVNVRYVRNVLIAQKKIIKVSAHMAGLNQTIKIFGRSSL